MDSPRKRGYHNSMRQNTLIKLLGKSAEVRLSRAPKWVLIFLKEHTLLAIGITVLFLSFLIS